MEPEIYIGVKVFFSAVAVALVILAALRGRRTRRVSFRVAVAFAALAVFWSVLSVSLLVYPPAALQLAASFGSQAIYFFAFGALAPALGCAAGLAALTPSR